MKKIVLVLSLFIVRLCGQDDPKLTEIWTPVPALVTPGINQAPPSDAIVLFNGTTLDAWSTENGSAPNWSVDNGILTVKPGSGAIKTRQAFADCQLHLEWRTPSMVSGNGQSRGNSGVFLQGRYEIQILDSHNNPTYVNGQAGAVYKQHIPEVNASLPPGEWQAYDIIYTAPRFNNDGTIKTPAFVTVLHNGVLVQNHVEIKGGTGHRGQSQYGKHPFQQPLVLQEHKNPVSFRNIWIRELGVHSLFNGTDTKGWYSYLDKLGKNVDPEGNFKIENGILHVAGKSMGYLATEHGYTNYYLKVVFKWGQHQYAPRATGKRDSGILYHFGEGIPDQVWPKSFEYQVQEGDCGDYWCVDGATTDSPNPSSIEWGMKHIPRTANFESPRDEWNIAEIICNGTQTEHYVNGHLVNSGTNANVSSGKILLQSEGAEIYYKSVELIAY